MMLYPSIYVLLENVNSRYMLVNVVSKRAREIAQEADDQRISLDEKPVKIAVQEVADRRLTVRRRGE